jgi:hypothetical protein
VNSPGDSLVVLLSNGNTTVAVDAFTPTNAPRSQWVHRSFHVEQFIQPTNNMTISFYAVDHAVVDSVFEVAIDRFEVSDTSVANAIPSVTIDQFLKLFPNPFHETSVIQYDVSSLNGKKFFIEVYDIVGKKMNTINIQPSKGSVSLGNDLTNGIYVVKLVMDDKMIAQLKAVKTK